jgi:PHD/YefM family antitoxin component YafN of YafNO toxin-antitoxin module
MISMTATTARRQWTAFLQQLSVEPVYILKNGKTAAVAISPELFAELQARSAEASAGTGEAAPLVR